MSDAQENTVEQPDVTTPTEQVDNPSTTETQQTEVQEQQETKAEGETEAQQRERDEKGRFKGVQDRIDELTRARRESEREAAYWKQVAEQGKAQSSAEAAPQKPTPDQFSDYSDYVEALTDWKAEQAVAKRLEQDSTRKVAETRVQTFQERQAEFKAKVADYDAVVGAVDTPLTQHVADVLLESDLGPQLTYHLAKNPDTLVKLNGMTPVQAARELGKLEATLSTPAQAPAAPAKKLTQAPAPAGTLGTQGRATTPQLANASMEEYMAQRKAQGARWAK